MQVLALRLQPGQDLRQSLQQLAVAQSIQAGFILSAIGSLQQAALRFADQPTSHRLTGKFELLSLHGTLSPAGIHLHATIADPRGQVLGGHVDNGCIIYTTAEIAIGNSPNHVFLRMVDEQTGFKELVVRPINAPLSPHPDALNEF
jgi:uncharacterized protein